MKIKLKMTVKRKINQKFEDKDIEKLSSDETKLQTVVGVDGTCINLFLK